MNGELAVLICLAIRGTEWLTGPGSVPAPDVAQTQSAFKFVSHVEFPSGRGSRWRKASPPSGTSGWLTELRRSGVRRLWLHGHNAARSGGLAPHIATSFSNGASWLLVAETGDKAEAWSARWAFSDETPRSPASWRIAFQDIGEFRDRPEQPSIEQATAGLEEQLSLARDFASRQSLGTWESWFSKALEQSTDIPYNPDLVPADYPLNATRLMSMAVRSWVWGGMGSWNDLSFAGEVGAEYERVSTGLYAANCRAFLAATNVDLRR